MMKKISRRSFLQVCGITAATAALTACGGGKTETAKKDDVHEAITFMAPYKEIDAFIEQDVYKRQGSLLFLPAAPAAAFAAGETSRRKLL